MPLQPGVVVYNCEFSTQKMGVGEAQRLRDSLCYTGRPRPDYATGDPVSKHRKKEGRIEGRKEAKEKREKV